MVQSIRRSTLPLSDAATALEGAVSSIGKELSYEVRGEIGDKTARKIGACAEDLIGACVILQEMIVRATSELFAQTASFEADLRGLSPAPLPVSVPHPEDAHALHASHTDSRRFAVSMKAVLFFLRSYHDALAWAVALVEKGYTPSENKTTMARLLDDREGTKKRIAAIEAVLAKAPEYHDWFWEWRDRRNDVKNGTHYDHAGPEYDPGLVPQEITYTNGIVGGVMDLSRAIRLYDVTKAIWMTVEVTQIVRDLLAARAREIREARNGQTG